MYDIIYIGGGLNYAGAIVAAKNGKKVALIERDMQQLGGVCLHKGCIPSKMFLQYANTLFESKTEFFKGSLELDMQVLAEKKESLLKSVTKVVKKQCSHFELIEGEAKVVAPHKVQVNDTILEAEHIVIGTGSHHFIPQGIEYNKEDIITSDEVLMLQTLPKKILIYGVGAIGLEMASFFATAGSEVTLVNRKAGLLTNSHEKIQEQMHAQLEKIGVKILENHPITKAKSTKKGVHVSFEDGSSIYTSLMLVATGRIANTDVVEFAGIEVKKAITTDASFETTQANHYAIGDCNGKLQLAHAARAQTLYVTQKILGMQPRTLKLDNVVKFIHTLPMSYAYVGKTKAMLEAQKTPFKESLVPLNQFTYSVYNHATRGMMVTYVDMEGFILGGEILSPHAEELIATTAMSLAGEMDATQAKRTILAHPTFSEALERTFYKL